MRELRAANQRLAATSAKVRTEHDELLVVNEEAQASGEEIETLNEELQATNEELETLNEELQATVEELTTTNDELEARTVEFQHLASARETERAWLEAVLSGIGDAVVAVDRAGQAVLTNDAYRRTFGEDATFVAEDDAGHLLAREATPQRRAANGDTFHMTFTINGGREGDRRWYEATGQPLRHEISGGRGVLAIRDITDRSLLHLQDQWLAIASHELRTPLTALLGTLQLAERRRTEPEQVGRHLAQSVRQARRLASLIGELVDTVRFESGRLTLHRAPVDLALVIAYAVETARAVAEERAIVVAVPATDESLWIEGDADRIEQVVQNLLINAVTHAPAGKRIELRLTRAGTDAMIEVEDDGPGIPATQLERIFVRYYQAGENEPRRDGLGLGLFIVREIVVAHGGTIQARSVVGSGTTFQVRLPLLANGRSPAPATG